LRQRRSGPELILFFYFKKNLRISKTLGNYNDPLISPRRAIDLNWAEAGAVVSLFLKKSIDLNWAEAGAVVSPF
jgi:hypothetical protein